MSEMGSAKTKDETHPRVVSMLFATYYEAQTDAAGNDAIVVKTADRGQTVHLSPDEEARLDALGALAPPGQSEGESKASAQARLDDYRAARGDATAVERAMARAIAPTDPVEHEQEPPPHTSPPGLGAAPRGTFTQGDTGGPDVRPPAGAPDGTGGLVRLDAPDVAEAGAAELGAWISEHSLNVDDTVALAEGDPARARKVLEAEEIATGGSPRKGVESKLAPLAEQK